MKWEYCQLRDLGNEGIVYVLYRTTTPKIKCIQSDDQEWHSLIATLGELGWEAVNTVVNPQGYSTWYFKRPIEPDNSYLTI